MANDRQELEELRRLDELEAKASGGASGGTQPAMGSDWASKVPQGIKDLIGAVNAGRAGMVRGATLGKVNGDSIPGVRQAREDHPVADNVGYYAGQAVPAAVAGGGTGVLADAMGGGALARIGANTAVSAGIGADQANPGERMEGALKGAALGGGLGAAGEGLSKILGHGADLAMQTAVGRTKYTPGVGTTLAEEGIGNPLTGGLTQNGMKKQVAQRMSQRGQQIGDLAKEVPEIDSVPIGDAIANKASQTLTVPGAAPSPQDLDKLHLIDEFGQQVAGRGVETGEQALARRVAAGQRAYRGKEDPLQSLIGKLSKDEQIKYSEALKNAHREVTGTNELADADQAYGALARARTSLDKEPSLPKSLLGLLNTGVKLVPGASGASGAVGQGLNMSSKAAKDPLLLQLLQTPQRQYSEEEK